MGKAKLTFLGTGTSQGVPIIGCHCPVCRSADPHDKRLRSAALVEYGGLTILVDAGPDFRIQMLREDVCHIDAILLTHNHMDHTGGLDDVRALNYIDRKAVHIYCEPKVLETLKIMFGYAFAEHKYPGSPEWRIHLIDDSPFAVMPVEGGDLVWMHEKYHDKMPVLGFRFGDIAYITDMSSIPESEFGKLRGLKHLTLNTVSYHPHHSHFSLSEAVALAQRIGAEHTWLTHLSHTFPSHSQFDSELPPGISPAYDGLVISD